MAGSETRKRVSSDKTMAKWPVTIDPTVDIITPYPCQTCKHEFRSCYSLAHHKCEPGSTTPPGRTRAYKPKAKATETKTFAEELSELSANSHDQVVEVLDTYRGK